MEQFEESFRLLLGKEGGYVDHKYDRGGKTRYGITEAVARQFGYTGKMKDFPLDLAKLIYRRAYWDIIHLTDIAGVDPRVAYELFESGVNVGVARVARWFQRSLNVMRRAYSKEPLFDVLSIDGRIGPRTLSAFKALPKQDHDEVLKTLNGLQLCHYFRLSENDVTQQINYRGWLKRVEFSKS